MEMKMKPGALWRILRWPRHSGVSAHDEAAEAAYFGLLKYIACRNVRQNKFCRP